MTPDISYKFLKIVGLLNAQYNAITTTVTTINIVNNIY